MLGATRIKWTRLYLKEIYEEQILVIKQIYIQSCRKRNSTLYKRNIWKANFGYQTYRCNHAESLSHHTREPHKKNAPRVIEIIYGNDIKQTR